MYVLYENYLLVMYKDWEGICGQMKYFPEKFISLKLMKEPYLNKGLVSGSELMNVGVLIVKQQAR